MNNLPMIKDLLGTKIVTDDEISAAVDTFMREPAAMAFRFAQGFTLDVAAAVKLRLWAIETLTSLEATDEMRRAVVRTAILMARPKKA